MEQRGRSRWEELSGCDADLPHIKGERRRTRWMGPYTTVKLCSPFGQASEEIQNLGAHLRTFTFGHNGPAMGTHPCFNPWVRLACLYSGSEHLDASKDTAAGDY